MTPTSILGACFDGLFDMNAVLTKTPTSLWDMHSSNSDVILSYKKGLVETGTIDSPLEVVRSYKSPIDGFRKSRIEKNVHCVAGLGISTKTEGAMLHIAADGFTTMARESEILIAGPIGSNVSVFTLK